MILICIQNKNILDIIPKKNVFSLHPLDDSDIILEKSELNMTAGVGKARKGKQVKILCEHVTVSSRTRSGRSSGFYGRSFSH